MAIVNVNIKGLVVTLLIIIHVFYGCVFFYNYGHYKSEQYMAGVHQTDLDQTQTQTQHKQQQQQQQQQYQYKLDSGSDKQQQQQQQHQQQDQILKKEEREEEQLLKKEQRLREKERENRNRPQPTVPQRKLTRYAYVTYVDNIKYAQGVAVLKQSLQDVGSTYDFVVLVSLDFEASAIHKLLRHGAIVQTVHPIDIPPGVSVQTARWMSAFTKFRAWEQTMYEKIIWLDSDLLVLQNIDDLFEIGGNNPVEIYSTIDANANSCIYDESRIQLINSGLVVLTPSIDVYKLLVDALKNLSQHQSIINDQDVMSYALKWKPLSYPEYGAQIPHCECTDKRLWNLEKTKVIHYTAGLKELPKPWEYFIDTNHGIDEAQTTNANQIQYQGIPQCIKGLFGLWHDKYDEEVFKLSRDEFVLNDWNNSIVKKKKIKTN